jgi:hypothetical protein
MGNELIRKRGDFNGQVVFGFFEPTLEAGLPNTTWFGMRVDLYSMNMVLTDEDGHLWNIMRFHDHAFSPSLRWMRTNAEGREMYVNHEAAERGYGGPVRHRVENGVHIIDSTQTIPGMQPYHFTRSLERMEWSEGDLFSLSGPAICPTISFVGPNPNGGWSFTSDLFELEGTVMGRKVKGFCEFGTSFAGPGIVFMDEYNANTLHWMIIVNRYTDGTLDIAHIGFMKNETRFAMIANENGPLKVTRDLKMEVELDEGGNLARYPKTVHLELGGEKWLWNAANDKGVNHPPVVERASREGYAQRVGDTRELAYGWRWLNSSGDGRIDPYVINKK